MSTNSKPNRNERQPSGIAIGAALGVTVGLLAINGGDTETIVRTVGETIAATPEQFRVVALTQALLNTAELLGVALAAIDNEVPGFRDNFARSTNAGLATFLGEAAGNGGRA